MNKRNIPPEIYDYEWLDFPRPIELRPTDSNGREAIVKVIERGQDEVCRLTVLWPDLVPASLKDYEAERIMMSMLREGSSRFTAEQIADTLDGAGAWLITNASPRYAVANLYCLSGKLTTLLPLLSDIILSPSFPLKGLRKVKDLEIDSLRLRLLRPGVLADNELAGMLCGPNNPFAWTPSEKGLESVERQDVVALHGMLTGRCMPEIWLAGKIDDGIIRAVESFALEIVPSGMPVRRSIEPFIISHDVEKCIDMPRSMQAAVSLGFPVNGAGSQSYAAESIVVKALGGYFGSRLNMRLREEKGYTYGVHAATVACAAEGYCHISAQTTTPNVGPLIADAKDVIEGMRTQKAGPTEINALRRACLSNIATMLESPFSVADYYISQRFKGGAPDYIDLYQHTVRNLTPEFLLQTAQNMKGLDSMRVVAAGAFNSHEG